MYLLCVGNVFDSKDYDKHDQTHGKEFLPHGESEEERPLDPFPKDLFEKSCTKRQLLGLEALKRKTNQ